MCVCVTVERCNNAFVLWNAFKAIFVSCGCQRHKCIVNAHDYAGDNDDDDYGDDYDDNN